MSETAKNEDSQPVVKVTLDRIYEQVLATKDLVTPIPSQVHDHELRLRIIEAFKAKSEGARALVTGVGYVAGGAVVGFALNHLIK